MPNDTGTIEIRFYDNGTLHTVDGTTRTFSNDISFSDVTIQVEDPTTLDAESFPPLAMGVIILLLATIKCLEVSIVIMKRKLPTGINIAKPPSNS